MKTLDDHNRDRIKRHKAAERMNEPHANGIARPECGEELWDSDPRMTLMSAIPQKNVHCPACGYRGYRVA